MKLAALACALLALGCQIGPRRSPYTILAAEPHAAREVTRSTAEWRAAQAWVARARAELPRRPYVERVRLSVVDPRTHAPVQVRGAVAVSPDRAARLVLIGPGGGTALDAWVTPDRYRVEIPSVHLTRRGGRELGADPRSTLGLPVGFLRWWFLSPLGGRLIDAEVAPPDDLGARLYRFHEPDATVELAVRKGGIVAVRRTRGGPVEQVTWGSAELAPASGTSAIYEDADLGLRVDVYIEEVMPNEPEPAAFVDPDLAEGS